MLEQLPHVKVAPRDLKDFLSQEDVKKNNKQIIIVTFSSGDLAKPKEAGKVFDKKEYYSSPENFEGDFEQYLDKITWLVQGIYWEAKYPRVLTKAMLKKAIANGTNKLMGVSDVSADECGSIEFTSRFTSIEAPYLLYDVAKDSFKETIGEMDPESNSEILFTSVDHLPAEMPKEASNHFGSKLIPFVTKVVKSDFSKPFE